MQAALKEIHCGHKGKVSLRVLKKEKARISTFGWFVFCVLLLAATVFFNLCQRVQIAQDVATEERLKIAIQQEELRQEKLVLQLVALKSPERIEKMALEKLGLVAPTEICYITLPEEVCRADAVFIARAKLAPGRKQEINQKVFPLALSMIKPSAKGL